MKKAHIISHSHWDREWYLPYEKHHMLQIEFMDTLIETLESDNKFRSFHLDGQTIMLEDYLQVRPNKKEVLKKLIMEGRLKVGPWYVLQDEWLTSSEANVRNLLVGCRDAKEYGDVCKIGYFPDSFGNIGQAPQILKGTGIDAAVFGRGVKPTGFNNKVEDGNDFESKYSELYWESPDGSKVLGILFANWYCNGMEIPTDEDESRKYWGEKIKEAEKYASTEHLLFMNGCDHQPVQTDLSEALDTARRIYPEIDFVHSNFEDYIKEVNESKREDLAVVKGELRSQQTDGWYTLANTASSRIYLKQMNSRCQMLYEKIAEPLATIVYKEGLNYPHELFIYGWKTLMQNHPHDSICGCSVDDVHREMITRFKKAENIALHIIDESLKFLSNKIDRSIFENINKDAKPFFIVNPSGYNKDGVVEIELEVEKNYFRDSDLRNCVNKTNETKLPKYKIIDSKGNVVPGTVKELANRFNYDLPKDKFRQPYISKVVKISMEIEKIPQFGWESFALIPTEEKDTEKCSLFINENEIENKFYKLKINKNGSINVHHKESDNTYEELCIYEDCGDIGNEYIFMKPIGDKEITTRDDIAQIKILEDNEFRAIIEVTNKIVIPKSADSLLEEEIANLIEFKDRKSKRSIEFNEMKIITTYTVERLSRGIKVKTRFNNNSLDHRLRVLFKTNVNSEYHYADSIFEVAKRDNRPSNVWENPSNTQHQQSFVNVHDYTHGLTIANRGLNEYEILANDNNTIALTIHRGVRELGDWGVFMTPEAQCLGDQVVEFEIIPHGNDEDLFNSYKEAYKFQLDNFYHEISTNSSSELSSVYELFKFNSNETIWSTLKVNEENNKFIARWYNVGDENSILDISTDMDIYECNLLENKIGDFSKNSIIKPYKIITVGME